MDPELKYNLTRFSENVSNEVRAVRRLLNGNKLSLSLLTTTEKSNLVAAINELHEDVQAGLSLEQIDAVLMDYFVLHPQSFTYDQTTPSNAWLILHPLDHLPTVSVTDSAGTRWNGQVTYPSANQVLIQFNVPLTGKAVLT